MPSNFYELTPLISLEEAVSQINQESLLSLWLEKEWVFLSLETVVPGPSTFGCVRVCVCVFARGQPNY